MKSGLDRSLRANRCETPRISEYRYATDSCLALSLYSILIWGAFSHWSPQPLKVSPLNVLLRENVVPGYCSVWMLATVCFQYAGIPKMRLLRRVAHGATCLVAFTVVAGQCLKRIYDSFRYRSRSGWSRRRSCVQHMAKIRRSLDARVDAQ